MDWLSRFFYAIDRVLNYKLQPIDYAILIEGSIECYMFWLWYTMPVLP